MRTEQRTIAMYRAIAAKPDLFCAYYEPMIGVDASVLAQHSLQSVRQIYTRSTTALRGCLAFFK